MNNDLTMIIAIVGLIASITAIITFILGRKEKGKQDGMEQGEVSKSLKFIEQTQTNILIGQKEMTAKLDKMNEKVIVLEVKEKMLEDKENDLEKRVEKLEKKRGE